MYAGDGESRGDGGRGSWTPSRHPGRRRTDQAADLDAQLTGLARLAATGDRRALDALLRGASPLLVRYCQGRLGNRAPGLATPEDVAQEVVIALCAALPRYRDMETPFMAFAYGIARNKVADAFRSAARDRSDPFDDLPESTDVRAGPEAAAVGSAQMTELMALIDRLPAQQREIVVLRVLGELTAEETAAAVGSTPGAVRVAQHRALGKLRTWLNEG
ncbi:RNA polymerase sigma factor ShbA [Pseudonocardia sp. RS11V-5]|uniref:RNA polymerase sigma factor ShbA n=1 Tax=Pseudonocardia terrae TaxID=2905831 RepID=UPI001E392227|nr:RNA polymerase sigma factor ShbA [Pseudonocardia terrae]MCE3554806.1 RNA polymerase sigma factor ShbA [Pseudonocardia terrae]